MIELINPYTVKILIAARDGDSIRAISKKIMESYGWTYKWISELEKIRVLERKRQKIRISKSNSFYKKFLGLIKDQFNNNLSLSDAYLLPSLSGLEFIFTETDAVFLWTKGGYNIGRSRKSYPIFIEILKNERERWEKYFSNLNLRFTFKNERKKGIYFIIRVTDCFEKDYIEKMPVLPLNITIEWMHKYIYNFEPALEMLDEMYNLKTGIRYRE